MAEPAFIPPDEEAAGLYGWCSLRLRFEEEELALLRAAEPLYGRQLAMRSRPDALRNALILAQVGRRLSQAGAGDLIRLSEGEATLLTEAAQFAADEIRWLSEVAESLPTDRASVARFSAIGEVFPDLLDRGAWRAFGLSRSFDALAQRLRAALHR